LKKNCKKIEKKCLSWCWDAPEDEAISLFAGLLANPDVPLSLETVISVTDTTSQQEYHKRTVGTPVEVPRTSVI
jgi:hypothetical protein